MQMPIKVTPAGTQAITRSVNKYDYQRSQSSHPRCFDLLHFFKKAWRPALASVLFLSGLMLSLLGIGTALSGAPLFGVGVLFTSVPGLGMLAAGGALICIAKIIIEGGNNDETLTFKGTRYIVPGSAPFEVFGQDIELGYEGYAVKKNPVGSYPCATMYPNKPVYVDWNWNSSPKMPAFTPTFYQTPLQFSRKTHYFSEELGWTPKRRVQIKEHEVPATGFVKSLRLFFQRIRTGHGTADSVAHPALAHPVTPLIADVLEKITDNQTNQKPNGTVFSPTIFTTAFNEIDKN
ncbi:hypothetical protein AAKU67_001496 [Oxalobacteraceae bacterium GrIS 2.11]